MKATNSFGIILVAAVLALGDGASLPTDNREEEAQRTGYPHYPYQEAHHFRYRGENNDVLSEMDNLQRALNQAAAPSNEYEYLQELNEYSPPPSEIELANRPNVLSQAAQGIIAEVTIPSLSDDTTIYVEYTTPQTGRININLQQDGKNIPLHVDIRYNWHGNRQVLVINSLKNNKWQIEKRPRGFPFNSGYRTTLKIVPSCAESAYRIYANGKFIYSFHSVVTPDKVERLYVGTEGTQPVQVTQLMVI